MTRAVINVTPLIDVLLVLLIIFMIITPAKPSSFKAKLPQEPRYEVPPPEPNPETLIVSLDPQAELALNREAGLGSSSDPKKLIDRLREVFDKREQEVTLSTAGDGRISRHVFVRAPGGLSYGSVIKVIDAVKVAGADPIALQIDELK